MGSTITTLKVTYVTKTNLYIAGIYIVIPWLASNVLYMRQRPRIVAFINSITVATLSIIFYSLFLWNPLFKKFSSLRFCLPFSENESHIADIIRDHFPYRQLDGFPDYCPLPEIKGLQKQPYASLKRLENGWGQPLNIKQPCALNPPPLAPPPKPDGRRGPKQVMG